MPNREKVIKGLEMCISQDGNERHEACPYRDRMSKSDLGCFWELMTDALELLKEQKTTFEKDGHHIRCTSCGNYWCDTDKEGDLFPHNYCPFCGKAVKWE